MSYQPQKQTHAHAALVKTKTRCVPGQQEVWSAIVIMVVCISCEAFLALYTYKYIVDDVCIYVLQYYCDVEHGPFCSSLTAVLTW